ncbi:MAG: CocE/NonD family hydrolase, partial [Ilyomonas sp.]
AVLVVGGWFDAEDMFGALKTYEAIEKQTPGNNNRLIMGPWSHGAWARNEWRSFGNYDFEEDVNRKFKQMQYEFFNYYLKHKGNFDAPEATIFFTGINQWKTFEHWPAKRAKRSEWFLGKDHALSLSHKKSTGYDEYVSDPSNPVPYINEQNDSRVNEYMTADQTFASQRNDVVQYTSDALADNVTLAGPVTADLFVSTTGTDADFIVKVIDVLPDAQQTQRLVRAEVLRGKFRKSFVNPEPFTPGKITRVRFHLNDVAHTFLKGHKVMIQIQSSWFPLADMNPQKFIDIAKADASDFKKETIQIYHDESHASRIIIHELK